MPVVPDMQSLFFLFNKVEIVDNSSQRPTNLSDLAEALAKEQVEK